MKKTRKGIIVWDESADSLLKPNVSRTDWKIKNISKQDTGVGLKDPVMSIKYTQNRLPIFTGDTTIVDDIPIESGATGYVIHESYNTLKGQSVDVLGKQVEKFFTKFHAPQITNKVWIIPYKGNPIEKVKNIKRYNETKKRNTKK